MRRWKPQFSLGAWVGLLLFVVAAGAAAYVALGLVQALTGRPETWAINLALFGRGLLLLTLLVVAGALLYRVLAAFTLRYSLDRNGLYISWLGNRAVIPLDKIQSVDVGLSGARLPWLLVQGIGYFWGQGRTADGRVLHLFTTRHPRRALAIAADDGVYSISPAATDSFVQELEQRRNLGATMPLAPTVEPSRMFGYAFWNDRTVRWLLLAAFALNLVVIGLLAARYPQLGPTVEMHFNAAGQVAELRPRHQVLFLPLAAFGLSLINVALGLLLYRREQLGARLLQGASVLVQVLFGVAVLTIIR